MQDQELAARLVTYSDAVVALAFVGVSAFGIAVADPDVRCSLAGARVSIFAASLLVGGICSIFLLLLRRWELDLLAEDTLSSKGRKYSRYLNAGRFLLTWIAVLATCVLVLAIDASGCIESNLGPG